MPKHKGQWHEPVEEGIEGHVVEPEPGVPRYDPPKGEPEPDPEAIQFGAGFTQAPEPDPFQPSGEAPADEPPFPAPPPGSIVDADFAEVGDGEQTGHDQPAPSIKEFLGEERDGRLASARRYLANLPLIRTMRDDKEIITALAAHLHEALTLLPARWHLEHAEADRLAAEAKQQALPQAPVSLRDIQFKSNAS